MPARQSFLLALATLCCGACGFPEYRFDGGTGGTGGLPGDAASDVPDGAGGTGGLPGDAGSDADSAAADSGSGDGAPDGLCQETLPAACDCAENGEHAYALCNEMLSQAQAALRCEAMGASLLRIDAFPEDQWVHQTAAALGLDVYWIGAEENPVDTWRWPDGMGGGDVFWTGTADGAPVDARYSNWLETQEPNNAEPDNCAYVESDGTWRDLQCDATRAYVCRR